MGSYSSDLGVLTRTSAILPNRGIDCSKDVFQRNDGYPEQSRQDNIQCIRVRSAIVERIAEDNWNLFDWAIPGYFIPERGRNGLQFWSFLKHRTLCMNVHEQSRNHWQLHWKGISSITGKNVKYCESSYATFFEEIGT